MGSIEYAIRLMVVGQALLIAAIFLFGSGSRALRWSAALLMLGILGYLVASGPGMRASVSWSFPAATLLAVSVPYSLWLFARAVFEAPWPHPAATILVVLIGFLGWAANLAAGLPDTSLSSVAGFVMRATALLIVLHALWLAVTGRPDDLVERRRSFRFLFIGVVAAQVIVVLTVELVLAGASPPAWLDLANVVIIAVMTLALAIPLLRLNPYFVVAEAHRRSPDAKPGKSDLPPASIVYRDKLLELMAGGYFIETGLTIAQLAAKLDCPEHQLRRLINRHLGYRNFSAFLNSYRIAEAKKRLADPDNVRTPVLTIALDLGYASLGPFNRAFKGATGTTPTEFRKRELARTLAETG
jgi:AraC-like DNA-binding protein